MGKRDISSHLVMPITLLVVGIIAFYFGGDMRIFVCVVCTDFFFFTKMGGLEK